MDRKIMLGAFIVLVLAFSGCTETATTKPTQETTPAGTAETQTADTGTTEKVYSGTAQVEIGDDFAFHPEVITVTKGTTVTWTNTDTQRHTVTFDEIVVGSSMMWRGETFSHRFDEPGTYDYRCTQTINMYGKVIVK